MDVYVPSNKSTETSTPVPKSDHSFSIILWTALGVIFIAMVLLLSVALYFWKKPLKKGDLEDGHHHPLPPPPDYSLDKLKLINIVGKCVFFF